MKFTAAQETVLLGVFKEADVDKKGTIAGTQVPILIKKVTGTKPTDEQIQETLGKAPKDLGDLSYEQVRELVGRHLADRRVTNWGRLATPLEGEVGIDTLPGQFQKKALKHGFQFNIMLIGGSGLGKSTMQNTLFKSLLSRTERHTASGDIPSTVEIHGVTHSIEEKGTRIKLTIVDTPGFGDQINNTDAWMPIVEYIKNQYKSYLNEELSPKRKHYIADTRVHVVLYFIAPTGHSLKAIDVECMKAIGEIANVVPVIAKADTLTLDERDDFKARVMEDLEAAGVRVFPFALDDDDEEDKGVVDSWRGKMPFAVVGADDYAESQLVRRTKWGTIQVENPQHCDLSLMRDLIVRNHLADLIRVTDKFFYEDFRTAAILGGTEQ
eukprot:comp19181_c0_seq1/m.21885 comp19181_c0_seq1/g.21885  ORF comp19181_c0_seq1/g.21885 comp19181_c0_seq1/m.21885 type:complete len:382 (-) comp19181_c0_seq1:428-1573(-)